MSILNTEELPILLNEQEEQPVQVTESAYQDLIGRLQRREEGLSFSSIKNFCPPSGCPWQFVQYKVGDKQTKAKDLGSVIDILLFTPWVEGEFIIMPDACKLNSLEGVKAYGEWLEMHEVFDSEMLNELVPKQNKKGGIELKPMTLQEKKQLIQAAMNKLPKGKIIISQSDHELAQFIVNRVQSSNRVMDFLECSREDERQYPIEFNEFGWKWRGRLDAFASRGPSTGRYKNGFNLDGKLMVSASTQKVGYTIREMGYAQQGAIYRRGLREQGYDVPHIILAYDRQGNYNLVEISERSLDNAWTDLGIYMKRFNTLVNATSFFENAFKESYTFWGDHNGVNQIW